MLILASSTTYPTQHRVTNLKVTKAVGTSQGQQILGKRMWKLLDRLPDKIKETITREEEVVATVIILIEVVEDTTIIKEEATIKEVAQEIITKIPEATTIEVVTGATVEVVAMEAMKVAEEAALITKEVEAAEVATTKAIITTKEEILLNGETTTGEAKVITIEVAMKMEATSIEEVAEEVKEATSISTNRNLQVLRLQARKETIEVGIREEEASIALNNSGSIPNLKEMDPPKSQMENKKRSEAS